MFLVHLSVRGLACVWKNLIHLMVCGELTDEDKIADPLQWDPLL